MLCAHEDVRAVLITAQGKNFSAGIDLTYFSAQFGTTSKSGACPARARHAARADILHMQQAFNAIESFQWPVVVAVQGACVGAGVDLITACDIRVCSTDASFCVKEVDVGITADLGTLQRLPHIVGYGAACDLALTGRTLGSSEAFNLRLVSAVYPSASTMLDAARKLVQGLALKSPLAIVGTKRVLQHARYEDLCTLCPFTSQPLTLIHSNTLNPCAYAREHSVQQGLEYVATWNSAMLIQSSDTQEAVKAAQQRRRPLFSRL